MNKIVLLFSLISISFCPIKEQNYQYYHEAILEAESFICNENYKAALEIYEALFNKYEFVFLKEYQVATQLAIQNNDLELANIYLKKGILAGWEIKNIKLNSFLKVLLKTEKGKLLIRNYKNLNAIYQSNLNQPIQKKVKKLFMKDQKMAMKALFTFSTKAQDKYAEKRFAPHSELQLQKLLNIINEYGYSGEQLIGNNYWTSTILSHHNSISYQYNSNDTLYFNLKPLLKKALYNGQISPFEIGLIDEWYLMTTNKSQKIHYSLVEPTNLTYLNKTNQLRKKIFLRTVEVRNRLIEIEEKTGMDFYLKETGWIKGKIELSE